MKVQRSDGNFFADYRRLSDQHRDLCGGVRLHAEEGRQEKGEVKTSFYLYLGWIFQIHIQKMFRLN